MGIRGDSDMAVGEVAESRCSKELYGLLSSSFHMVMNCYEWVDDKVSSFNWWWSGVVGGVNTQQAPYRYLSPGVSRLST